MSFAHETTLTTRHAELEARLSAELGRPHPDGTVLATIKKQKLRLKEALAALRARARRSR